MNSISDQNAIDYLSEKIKNSAIPTGYSKLWEWLEIWCGDWLIIGLLVVKKPMVVQLPNYNAKTNMCNSWN